MNVSRFNIPFNQYRLFLLFFVLIGLFQIGLAKTITLHNFKSRVAVNYKSMNIWEDCNSDYTIDSLDNNEQIHNMHSNRNIDCTYWVMFELKNNSGETNWVLENNDPHVGHFEVFVRENNELKSLGSCGYAEKFSTRPYHHKNFVFDIPLQAKDKKITLLIKYKSSTHFGFNINIIQNKDFTRYALGEYILLGMFYGIIAIMAFYNLFIYFNIKERSYLFYVIYAISCALKTFTEDGIGFQYLWPDYPQLNTWVEILSPSMLIISFLLYSNSFIELKTKLPKIRIYILISVIATIIIDSYSRFISPLSVDWTFISTLPYFITYFAAIVIYRNGYKPARFFIIGFSVILISFVIFFLRIKSILPGNTFTVYIFNYGFILETIILSYALGDKLKITREEKERAQKKAIQSLKQNERLKDKINRELENEVKKRTTELEAKTNQLTKSNTELNKVKEELFIMNAQLDKDNWNLKKEVKHINQQLVTSKIASYDSFKKIFPDHNSCLKYLNELKSKSTFSCKKCSHTKFSKTQDLYTRKCTKCKHVESATAYTLFHGVRFPLEKAFYIAYVSCRREPEFTIDELSTILDLRRNTCWSFRKKVEELRIQLLEKNLITIDDPWEKIVIV